LGCSAVTTEGSLFVAYRAVVVKLVYLGTGKPGEEEEEGSRDPDIREILWLGIVP